MKKQYCTGGIKWFVVKGKSSEVFSCHINYYKQSPLFLLDEPLNIRDNIKCSLKCNNPCDHCHVVQGNNSQLIDDSKEIRVLFYINSTCPQECSYCYCQSALQNQLSLEKTIVFLNNIKNKYSNYLYQVIFCGGEPSIYPDLEKLIFETNNILNPYKIPLYSSGINKRKFQNISLFGRKLLDKLEINISCHPTGKVFNMHRFLETIELIRSNNILLSVSMVNHLINEPFIPIYKKIFNDLQINFRLQEDHGIHGNRKNIISKHLKKTSMSKFFKKINEETEQ